MDLFQRMSVLAAEGRPFVLATVVDSGGSSPQKPGAKLLVEAGGTLHGTVGGGAIEHRVIEAARALLADANRGSELLQVHLTHDLGMCCGGAMSVFLEKVAPAERLILFGAGHVGRALACFAHATGFQVTVVDARPELLDATRFPHAERILAPPDEAAATVPTDPHTIACVMTHDHPLDQRVVEALIRRPLRYLGMIGSRRKAEKCRIQLDAKGYTAEEIARLRSPMGIHIGAETPEEIAVSMIAELVALRRDVDVRPLQAKVAAARRPAPPDGGEGSRGEEAA